MLSQSFDQFYIVTRFELPKTKDLRLATFKFDFKYSYANDTSTNTNYAKLLKYCMKFHHTHDFTKDKYSTISIQPMTHWQMI